MDEADDIQVTELIEVLSSKEDMFALAYIEYSGNPGAAYKAVFGENANMPTAKGRALLAKPAVVARIKELSEANAEFTMLSMEDHLVELASIRDVAKQCGQLKVALDAEVSRGKVAGLYVGKSDVPPPVPVQTMDHLNQLAGRLTSLVRATRKENLDVEDATYAGQPAPSPLEVIQGSPASQDVA